MPLLQQPHKALPLEALQGDGAVEDSECKGPLLDLHEGRAARRPIPAIQVLQQQLHLIGGKAHRDLFHLLGRALEQRRQASCFCAAKAFTCLEVVSVCC